MKNLILLIFVSLFLTQCYPVDYAQNSNKNSNKNNQKWINDSTLVLYQNFPKNAEPEKCYARCLIPGKDTIYSKQFAVYTGIDTTCVDTVNVVVRSAIKKLHSKGATKFNPSSDYNIFILREERPERVVKIPIVKDTTICKDYRILDLKIMETSNESISEWQQVLCPRQVTPAITQQLSSALKAKGFYKDEPTKEFSENIKKALIDFQKANNLPVGQLDVETLNALGINY